MKSSLNFIFSSSKLESPLVVREQLPLPWLIYVVLDVMNEDRLKVCMA